MKKIFVSLGLAAAGTASLHASDLLGVGDSKIWTVQGTLRGFYDDNYFAVHSGKQGSFGFEVNPSFSLHMPMAQTELGIKYTYGLYYYQKREENHQNPIDQSHQFDLWLDHAFNPRLNMKVADTVTVSQDPPLTSAATATAQRISGNNIANTASLGLNTDWTRMFSTAISYQNSFYDYENSGATVTPATPLFSPGSVQTSYSGLLDRIEQTIGLEGQWHIAPTTTILAGYDFGLVNFTGNEPIAIFTPPPFTGPSKVYFSNARDNYSHYLYVGAHHDFLENLSGNAKVGVQYTKYYNDPSATTSLGPYADMSLIYTYAPGSYAQLGFTESRNATDTVQIDSNGHITTDEESSVLYASINQPLTPKLTASIVGHYQYSIYNNGQFNNQAASFYNLGLNCSYAFTRHFSSEVGYNFDYYTTPVQGQSYSRNRIYLGFTASY